MIKVIEFFAGIGAQRQAPKDANIEHEVIAISEIDKYAIKAYEYLHGKTPNLGDITKIEDVPKADIWTYSFPCTDISISGRMQGFEKGTNTHSSLLWEVQRLLLFCSEKSELPKYLLMENVKNLVSKKFKPQFDEWCEFLEGLGYKNFYQVLNAKDYGIPQNRERVFMASILDSTVNFTFPKKQDLQLKLGDLLEPKVDEKYFISSKLINCLSDMTDRNGLVRGLQFKPKFRDEEYARTITSKAGTRPCDNYIIEPIIAVDENVVIVPQATKDGYAIAEAGDGIYTNRCQFKRGVVQKDKIPTLKTSNKDIAVVVTKETENYIQWKKKGEFDKNCRAFKEDKVSATIDTNGQTKVLTNEITIRRLTPRECFRLMGFKDCDIDKFINKKDLSDTQLFKIAGNSIVVNCLKEIFKNLFKTEEI